VAFRSLEKEIICDLRRLASFLPTLPTKILGKLKKGGLGLGSNESELLGLRVDVLESGGVDRDRLVEQTLELRREDCVGVPLLDREIVSVFPIALGLVGGLGHVLLLVRCVRECLVLLEVANKFRMDAD
jgi:hypothetical protein